MRGIDDDAIGARVLCEEGHEENTPCIHLELSNIVSLLDGKPDLIGFAKHEGMWITGIRIRHGVFGDALCPGIEFADMCGAVAGIPHHSLCIDYQIMWTGARF